ncbi:MAG: hypothetical protein ACK5RL_09950 [Acidimicrobiales bacterium]
MTDDPQDSDAGDPQAGDPQDRAEALDEDEFLPETGSDELPGQDAYSDAGHRLNVEDPAELAGDTESVDGVEEREWRMERPGEDRPRGPGLRLAEADGDVPDYGDDEGQAVAEVCETIDASDASAEEAALHIEGDGPY